MTVKELREFLEKCNDNMEVTVMCCDEGCNWTVPANCEIRKVNGTEVVYIGDEQEFI